MDLYGEKKSCDKILVQRIRLMSEWSTGRNWVVSIRTSRPGAAKQSSVLVRVTYRKWIRIQLLAIVCQGRKKRKKAKRKFLYKEVQQSIFNAREKLH